MKRFEYYYVFKTRLDPIYEDIMSRYHEDHKPMELREFPVKCYLDSYKEAIQQVPNVMLELYDFMRIVRTGKKFRTTDWKLKIWFYLFRRRLRR